MKFYKSKVKYDDFGQCFWMLRSCRNLTTNMLSYSFYKKIGAVDYAGQIHWGYIDIKYQIVPVCIIWLATKNDLIWKSESSTSRMSQDLSVTLDLVRNIPIAIGYFVQQIVFIRPWIAESIFMAVLLITLYVTVMAFCQSAWSEVDQSTNLLVQLKYHFDII